jgi:hypothetical protein
LKPQSAIYQKVLSWAMLVVALALLYAGSRCFHQVYYDPTAEPPAAVAAPTIENSPDGETFTIPAPPKPLFEQISDSDLVANATFTGVVRRDGRLYWTYDPSQKQGKQACPT